MLRWVASGDSTMYNELREHAITNVSWCSTLPINGVQTPNWLEKEIKLKLGWYITCLKNKRMRFETMMLKTISTLEDDTFNMHTFLTNALY